VLNFGFGFVSGGKFVSPRREFFFAQKELPLDRPLNSVPVAFPNSFSKKTYVLSPFLVYNVLHILVELTLKQINKIFSQRM